jgi:hypothetical protein
MKGLTAVLVALLLAGCTQVRRYRVEDHRYVEDSRCGRTPLPAHVYCHDIESFDVPTLVVLMLADVVGTFVLVSQAREGP